PLGTHRSMSRPTNKQTCTGPANITLKAWATDSDGSISSVQFYQGTNTTPIGTGVLSGTNYLYTWNSVGPAGYALYAKATDDRGGVRLSDLVDLTVYSTND